MAHYKTLIFLSIIYFATAADKSADLPPGAPVERKTTTIKPHTTTTPAPPKTTNATTPTTTPPPITTPTTPSTTAKPTPAPAPPTPVDPKPGTWIANYTSTNRTCIVFQAAIQISIPYKYGNDTKNLGVNVPENATATGDCSSSDAKSEVLALAWGDNKVTLNFGKTNDSKFELEKLVANLNVTIPGNNKSQVLSLSLVQDVFVAPVTKSYKCFKEQNFNLTDGVKNSSVAELRVSHLQIQAFRNATNTNFDDALDCSSSETPDVVPIAVGCALAALVLVVLIAYLIGRRRSQARGYLSM